MSTSITPEEIYDWLVSLGIKEPAVCKLGPNHVIGRWEEIAEVSVPDVGYARVEGPGAGSGRGTSRVNVPVQSSPPGYVMRSGKVAIHVLGEGPTWIAARDAASTRLACFPTDGVFICGGCKKPIAGMTVWTGLVPGPGPRHPECERPAQEPAQGAPAIETAQEPTAAKSPS